MCQRSISLHVSCRPSRETLCCDNLTEICDAENAQLSSAMQGVQISQAASDVAQAGYDAAIERQAKSLAAMAEVSKKLKRLQEDGQTLVRMGII